ncbi:hypothetical protein A2V56_04880 [Candidatus Woesebacteria bacterium RBG_19FT_COMBO_42_9]|uniref:Zinc-ribbon domain-containing protein n=1 Tax=Candidatus Woesebacteria bacterium RBG_16_42_24 TaxID=1802485 RepID=A0A1F7XLQ2_9BACT|nr:MAG: hypothetical protein A2V97_04110 [Candidatus Woesebacteria bacterium RBG_16_42_24]OGM17732.1 MAG: hypothetical protein A2V56_04880 [Candidatus Woesebacteria bacterium RBG_19FT_COMBO_42_9]OGM66820.1 MAG: hypothetical protein A2985_01560 [Candidatus Woesebacteria bacterium RIFCSPLOWO2_01_FULL_43_11]
MDDSLVCPSCHIEVRSTDYFCYNCGKNLKPKPLSTSLTQQILIYLGSVFLPPLGLVWGVRYLRQEDNTSKIVGVISIVLTAITSVLLIKFTNDLIKTVNEQVNSQLQEMQGF